MRAGVATRFQGQVSANTSGTGHGLALSCKLSLCMCRRSGGITPSHGQPAACCKQRWEILSISVSCFCVAPQFQ